MSEKKSWRDYSKSKTSEDEKTGSWRDYSSNKTGGGDASGGWREYSKNDAASIVSSNVVNRVNSWLDSHNSYISDYQKRNSGRKYNYEDAYVSDSSDWLNTATQRKSELDAEADAILSYLEQNKKYLDSSWAEKIKSTLSKARETNSQIVDYSTKDHEWWSGFGAEELVKQYGSAEDAYKYYQRDDGYRKKYDGLSSDELTGLIDSLDDGEEKEWLSSYKSGVYHDEMLQYDTGKASQELDTMEKVLQSYGTAARYYDMYQANPDAYSGSEYDFIREWVGAYEDYQQRFGSQKELENRIQKTKRDLEYATKNQAIAELSSVAGNADFGEKSQYVNNVEYGLFGKPTFTDNTYAYVNNPIVDDKRAAGRSATARELIESEYDAYNWDSPLRNRDSSYDREALAFMSEDEVKIYNYLYATEGAEKAREYLDLLVDTFKDRKNVHIAQNVSQFANEHPWIASAASVGTSLGSGFEYIEDAIEYGANKLVGNDAKFDTNEAAMMTNAVRNTVSEKVDWEIGNWDAFDFVYNTVMSGADSLASTAFGGWGGAVLGLSAAAQGTNDALERGMSSDQAFWNGLFSGVFEGLFETISIGQFNALKEVAPKSVKDIIKNLGKSMLVNASEETLTEIANIGYDTLVNGEFANYTLEELENGAWKQALQQVLEAGASGALMGVGMGGVSTGIGHVGGKIQANAELVKQYGDRTGELIQEGLGNDAQSTSYKLAQKYQQKTENGKTMTGQQIRKLLEANQDQITAKDMKLIQQAAEQRLSTLGQTEDVSKIAELATKYATGGKLSNAEKTFLTSSQYGSRVANELMPKNIESGDYSTDWAEGIGTKSVNALHYNIKNIVAEMTKVEDPAAYKSLESRVEAEEPAKVSNTGKAVIRSTNEEIDLASPTFKQVGKDGTMLEANGKMVNANDIDYDSEEQGRAINAIGKIEHITPAAASALYAKLDMEKPVMAQLNGMDEAFTYGFYNYSEADLNAGLFVGNLTQEQKTDAYKLGQYVAKNTATEKADAMKKMRTAAEAKAEKAAETGKEAPKTKNMTITYNEGNGKVVDFDKAGVKLSSKQKAAPVIARVMHDMGLGTNFELFSSYLSKTLKDDKGRPARVFLNDQGVEEVAYSGVYRKKDGTIRIDLNAYNGRQLTLNAMAHELTHFIQQWSTEKYEALAEFLVKTYEKTNMTMHERVLREQARLENIRKEKVSYDEAYDEVVANAMSKMLDDGKVMEKLTELQAKDASLAKKLWEGLKKLLDKFFRIYEKESALFYDADDLMDLKAEFEQLQQMWAEAFVEASENFQAAQAIGFEMDMDTESVSPAVMHSEHTWTESDYVQERNKAAQEIAKAIGVSVKKAKDYIDSINSIAKMIAEDRSRLDYFSSPGRSSFVDNSEYGGSFDFSTLCKKRRLLTGTFTAIQKALPNTALTANEILDIRNRMKEKGLEVSCGLCYVEGSRANMGQFAKEFLRLYKQYYPDAWQPNMADVNTPDGIEWVRINHPECYEQYEYFWNHYGTLKEGDKNLFASQQKPKLYQLHTEYKGEILNKFKNDDKVEDKNINGGIRLQSFSDFEIVHLIDTMQIIMDMSRVGLAGQAYTKVPDFAWALGDTGLKINLSLIAKGVDADGKLIFDDVEGMPIADAMKLRDRYSKNVGTILVAFNDEQLLAAMADDRVDFIIPFHRSQWKKSQYGAMGLPAKTKDYTFMQNEKYIKPQFHEYRGRMVKDKATNYMPNEYWDFSKSGKENAEAYLEMCARNNKRPKFYKLLQNNGDSSYSLKSDGSTDGYWKLLIDFKMYDNEGNGSPQLPVKPEFNMEEANRMLETYKGGHSNFPVAQGIVDEFVKDYKANHKGEQYSSQETDIDTSSAVDYDNKNVDEQEVKTNETRKESGEAFDRRTSKELFRVAQKGQLRYAYRPYLGTEISERAKGAEKELKKLGIPVFVYEKLETNFEGITEFRDNDDSAAIPGVGVFIPFNAVADSKDIVGHEGFHFLAASVDRADYVSVLVDNIDFASAGFISYYKYVQDTYFKKTVAAESKDSDDSREKKSTDVLAEEIFAFITGDIHNGDPKGKVHQFIRDYDAVKNAWDDLLRKHSAGVLYSSHETDNISNRDLLANAFEGITQNSNEYKLIQQYKSHVAELNSLEEKLSDFNREIRRIRFTEGEYDAEKLRRLEDEAKKIATAINKHDKELLSLEASEPLRKVIEREKTKAKQKTMDHVKEIQQNKKVRAEQTELRQKIRKKVRDLDKILNRGNKKQNVKEDMKGFVSKALELADYLFTDHISNDELIRKGITVRMTPKEAALVKETENILSQLYDNADSLTDEEFTRLDAKRKANEDKLRDLLTAQRNERLQTPVYKLFSDLVTEYSAFKNSKQDAVKAAYNPEVERFLRSYIGESNGETDSDRKTLLENMRVADMTTEELWKLDNAYQMVLHAVRTANKLFVNGKAESIEQVVNSIASDFGKRKIPEKDLAIVVQKLANKIGWNYEKLYYALDRIGSEAFTELFMNLANSENIVMQDIIEAVEFRDQMVEKYGHNNWALNKKIDTVFMDNTGKHFRLTLGEMMALYAYSRREGAYDHLEYGGFMFGKEELNDPNPANTYKLNRDQLKAITDTLTIEQKAYAEEMQKYLSEVMGEKGNEVSTLLYGVKMFGEKNYFPIHVSGVFKAQAQESQAKAAEGFQSMSNAGFTHAQNSAAKAPIILESFDEVWSDHVNEMSRYHGAVPALEDIRRVMNRSFYSDNVADSTAIKQLMINKFGNEAAQYFDNLYREANSGAITDKLQNTSKKLLSLFRKNSVAYSLSVLVQQPASIVRAYAMIDRKYFGFKGVGAITSGVAKAMSSKWNKAYENAYNEMLKYAPGVTMTKEIGGFDTATGGSIRSYLLDADKSFKQKWTTGTALEKGKAVLDVVDNNAIANLPNVADKIAWIEIWNACKRETLAKHNDLAPTSEAFMKIVGDRFTEVIRATQVYDSIFAKSPMLKSKYLAVQMLVSFMNEPNTVANMAESAVRDFAKGNRMEGLKKAHVLVHSIIFTGVLKSLIYAMRDDDEDETYIEKYIESLTGSLMDDFNPLNYIPIARDVWSIAQGYDVERADMAIVSDAIGALNNVIKAARTDRDGMTEEELIELDKKITQASWNLVDALSAFTGIPMKNIRREINAVIDHAKIASANAGKTTALSTWDTISEAVIDSIPFMGGKSKTDKLYAAIIEGDTEYINRLKATYKTEDSYHTAVRKALRENDPRIKEAAQAQIDGDPSKRVSIAKQIIADGFILDDVVAAINSEINAMTTSDSDSGAKKEKGYYTAADIAIEAANGDWASVRDIKDDIIQTAQKNGKTKDEAEGAFESSVRSEAKEAYIAGSLDDATAEKLLVEYTAMGEDEAATMVSYWAFCRDNPKYAEDINQSQYVKYTEFAEPAGIPVDVFVQYLNGTKGLADIKDKWGDVELSKRDQVLAVIDSLPLTRKQKDALYLAADYAESKIWDVPW